jgi:guanyl-specific ribonuclease Sa
MFASALAFLLSAAWLPSVEPSSAAEDRGRLVSARPVVLEIEPGRDLEPKFSDPNRVRTILKLIEDVYYGRPLQYPKDGTVFQNKEGRLPSKPKGFYREYTVMPPKGSPSRITVGDRVFNIQPAGGSRGAERLIIGGGSLAYYSPDHYKTFIPLVVLR